MLQMCLLSINAYYVSFCHPADSMIQFDLMSMDLDLNPIHSLARFYGSVVADSLNSVQRKKQREKPKLIYKPHTKSSTN